MNERAGRSRERVGEGTPSREELLASYQDLASILESMLDPVIVANPDGIIRTVNRATLELLGYTEEELLGKPVGTIFEEEEEEEEEEDFFRGTGLARLVREGAARNIELTLLAKSGERIPVVFSGSVIRKDDGHLSAVVGVARDMRERLRAEEALKLRFVNLAETVSRIFTLRDPYVGTHQHKTAKLAAMVGERMGLGRERLEALYIGSLLHDIGKVAIPEGILRKPGELTAEEWRLVRTHTHRGYELLKDTELPSVVAELALHHHERLDGSGYPDGLKGDELSMEVRILAVCNVVGAMSEHRPWRPARSKREIVQELKTGKGTRYDPRVVDLLLAMIERGELELAT